jgi:hypothetical protein
VPVDERTVERLRRYYELWSTEEYLAARDLLFDSEIELVQPRELPGGTGVYRGYEGLAQALFEALEVDARIGHRFVFHGERAVRWEVYLSPQEALAAAGLSGEQPTPG